LAVAAPRSGVAGHGDAPAPAELEQTLVAKQAERAEDRVAVDAEDGSEVARRRLPFANFSGGLGYYGYHDWNELAAWYQPR
jgi:hypothetical protein